MLPYVLEVDASRLFVKAPTDVVFLCGGQMSDIGETVPRSIRDAFYKILIKPALKDRDIIVAEDITQRGDFRDFYQNILDFEIHLAQITELILLFCESEGSFAELGAFAITAEIAQRLLVVVRDKHWNADSFIKLGPLELLNRAYPDSVCVLDDLDINFIGDSPARINLNTLNARLEQPLVDRLAATREPKTFNSSRDGHLIKLAVGLIQDYGALTVEELQTIFRLHNIVIDDRRLSAYLLCACAVDWIKLQRKGIKDYFFAKNVEDAANFYIKGGAERNKGRRRAIVREHWKKNDPPRSRGIEEVFGVIA